MPVWLAFVVACLLGLDVPVRAAPPSPRDQVLRLAPADFALVMVVQDLRGHLKEIGESPFAAWFPESALGQRLMNDSGFKGGADGARAVLGALGVTPTDLFHDLLGDAVVFAYAPPAHADPKAGERSVILLRPRKPDALAALVDRLNDIQKKSGELKAVAEHTHAGAAYFERQKPNGPSDFYCFRGGVFAFSQSEPEIRAVLDRDQLATDRPPELAARMAKLGVSSAAAVVLLNPRRFDAELAAKVKAVRGHDGAFLARFAEVWAATDAAAVYLTVGHQVELGVAVHFAPDKLPAGLKPWLVGPRTPSALWASVPDHALLAFAGRVKPDDVLKLLAALQPADGKSGAREALEHALGPVLGRDKVPLVLDALGPDWGFWVAPPAGGGSVPVTVVAVKLGANGPKGVEASKLVAQALEYGFQVARISHNGKHKEQLELKEERDGAAIIKSLSGGGLPAGFSPCFALKGGHLLLSTSPDAVRSFKPPQGEPEPGGDVPLVRFSALNTRAYLTVHTPKLVKLLADVGAGEERALAEELGNLALVLESVEKVELFARGDTNGLKLMLRVKPTKPLKK